MEGFSSNLKDTFTSTRGCAEPIFFPQHILPLLPLYNAQWWGYESLTAIVLVGTPFILILILCTMFPLPGGMWVCPTVPGAVDVCSTRLPGWRVLDPHTGYTPVWSGIWWSLLFTLFFNFNVHGITGNILFVCPHLFSGAYKFALVCVSVSKVCVTYYSKSKSYSVI